MYIPGVNGRGVFPDTRSELAGAEVSPVSHVTTYTPNEPIQNAQHHHLLTWILKAISTVLFTDTAPSPASSGSLGKRADTSPNTLTSVVAGVLVTAFVIFVGIFLYIYRRSIYFRKRRRSRRHRHRRRASGNSKISQGSEAVGGGGGGGDGGADEGAAAADPPAEA